LGHACSGAHTRNTLQQYPCVVGVVNGNVVLRASCQRKLRLVAQPLQNDFETASALKRPDHLARGDGGQLDGLVRIGEKPVDRVVVCEDVDLIGAVVVKEVRIAIEAESRTRSGQVARILRLPFRRNSLGEVCRVGGAFLENLIAVQKRGLGDPFIYEIAY
jgi:hypothetical protein